MTRRGRNSARDAAAGESSDAGSFLFRCLLFEFGNPLLPGPNRRAKGNQVNLAGFEPIAGGGTGSGTGSGPWACGRPLGRREWGALVRGFSRSGKPGRENVR